MDGVLVDSRSAHRAAWAQLVEELGEGARQEDAWSLSIGRRAEEALRLILGRRVSEVEVQRLAVRKRALYALNVQQGMVMAVSGVVSFVNRLIEQQVLVGIATSAQLADVDQVLPLVGLQGLFHVIVGAEHVRRGKPDPEVYVLARQRLGVGAGACIVFEDSVVGIQGATAAGMRAIGVTTSYSDGELRLAGAMWTVADFSDVEWPPVGSR
jgi:HAD superfamily hydrolase (TIGR01509 family)